MSHEETKHLAHRKWLELYSENYTMESYIEYLLKPHVEFLLNALYMLNTECV